MASDKIVIRGAAEHNLKNVDVEIPRDKLVVFTGLSGSGKSSLAFDTIYAEGQRRYVESLSSYARQFLGQMEKPNVESIDGLSPAISIDQKTTSKNPRSVWDSKFIESYRKWSYTEWQQMLDRADKKERAAIAAGTPRDWTLETVDISKAVYAGTVEGANLSYQYLYDFGPLCEEQLLKAGYRLAALLNELFG